MLRRMEMRLLSTTRIELRAFWRGFQLGGAGRQRTSKGLLCFLLVRLACMLLGKSLLWMGAGWGGDVRKLGDNRGRLNNGKEKYD